MGTFTYTKPFRLLSNNQRLQNRQSLEAQG